MDFLFLVNVLLEEEIGFTRRTGTRLGERFVVAALARVSIIDGVHGV